MKDFDVIPERDRSFKIGGVTFTFKPSLPARLRAEYEDIVFDPESKSTTILVATDRYILACLTPGQEEAWAAVRDDNAERPVSAEDLRGILAHIEEVTAGRPTEPSSASTGKPPGTGTGSTAGSPSPVAAA